ncbi:hypothetical protein PtoMrB4_07710 [Metapseudomonas otitidis]|uniref:Uncharacterized protein n=1 Tax=Metapseudomonas otitidis TaxID=319939 RepID=A0A679GLD5_9GAMM|nr:hypothetical protein PtoMrB4_07710 [Pseudomonas otitidis]
MLRINCHWILRCQRRMGLSPGTVWLKGTRPPCPAVTRRRAATIRGGQVGLLGGEAFGRACPVTGPTTRECTGAGRDGGLYT